MNKFHTFLESLRTKDNNSLIESIHQGFSICFEETGPSGEFISRRDWQSLGKIPRHLSLNPKYYPKKQTVPPPEKDTYIPEKDKPRRNPRYHKRPDAENIKKELITEMGGYKAINSKGKMGWRNFQIELNKRLTAARV